MTIKLDKLTALINYVNTTLTAIADSKQTIADLQAELATALSNDVADAQTIAEAQALAASAQAEADASKELLVPLQAQVDADLTEDESVNALLDSVVLPEISTPIL